MAPGVEKDKVSPIKQAGRGCGFKNHSKSLFDYNAPMWCSLSLQTQSLIASNKVAYTNSNAASFY